MPLAHWPCAELTRSESTAAIVFYTALFMSLGSLPVLPFYWIAPSPVDLVLLSSIGLIGGISQYWVTQALHYAPAAVVSPFNYMALIRSAMLGFLMWGEVPTMAMIIGAVIVTLSGFYLLRHETTHPTAGTRPSTGR
jgi:drug/metabolite transporter (DMT)-like permease